jgi:hypothetical protein
METDLALITLYDRLISFLKCSQFFATSSFHVSSVYPCTSNPCFLALARSSSSVSPYIVCVHTGSPASLQFRLSVIWLQPVKSWLLLSIYESGYRLSRPGFIDSKVDSNYRFICNDPRDCISLF